MQSIFTVKFDDLHIKERNASFGVRILLSYILVVRFQTCDSQDADTTEDPDKIFCFNVGGKR